MMCGGTSAARELSAEELQTVLKVKPLVESKLEKSLSTFKPVSIKTQVVAGTNYFVKVENDGEYLHLRIFLPLPHAGNEPELHGVQTGKSADDPLEYFESS